MGRILGMCLVATMLVACSDDMGEEVSTADRIEPSQELTVAAETAEAAFQGDAPLGMVAVQGGQLVQGPLTATGNLQGADLSEPRGAVTITEASEGTQLLITFEGWVEGGELQATLVRGGCGTSGVVVEVIEPVMQVPAAGVADLDATIPVPTSQLFDGQHAIKIVPAPAQEGPQDAGTVLACADLRALSP